MKKPKLNFVFQVDVHSARNGFLTPNAKAVMLVYRSYADERGIAYPSQETIRRHTRLSRPTIRKCIKELIDHHILTWDGPAVRGKHGEVFRITNGKQVSTSTYHLGEGDNQFGEQSISGLLPSLYDAVKDRFVSESQDFEDIEF